MKESWTPMLKAREILATPSQEGLCFLVDKLFIKRKDTHECKAARALYDFCVKTFPNCLTRKLLMLHRDSSEDIFRLRSIYLLSELSDHGLVELSPVALHDIKPLVITCLTMRKHERSQAKILGTIVSLVAYNVMTLNNGRWDELSDCILSLAGTEPLKAFHVFLGLPPIKNREFINRFMGRALVEAKTVFLDPEPEEEDWCLALETVVKIGIQILNTEDRYDSIQSTISILVNSVTELGQEKEMKQVLQQRLEVLEKFLSRDNKLYNYSESQCLFVSELATELKKRGFKFCPCIEKKEEINSCDRGVRFGREGYEYLKTLSSLQILELVMSKKLEGLEEESAIRQLNVLLYNHTNQKKTIDIAVMRQLKSLLICCLEKQEFPENTFMILGQVVRHVAIEMFTIQEEKWVGLRDYIKSHCHGTEFSRGCYIFRCLTMPLDEEDFVIPVMEKLLPEIRRMLNPRKGSDNFSWVVAFICGFCAIIHMINNKRYAEDVREIEDKMIESVRHLVERRMEIGLVTRAFKEMEIIVKEEVEWYTDNEFTFVMRLLRSLLAIEGMKIQSQMLLKRISMVLEKKAVELCWKLKL